MSILGAEIYGHDVLAHEVPLWMKNERYEYCEPFFDTIVAKKQKKSVNSFVRTLTSLFL